MARYRRGDDDGPDREPDADADDRMRPGTSPGVEANPPRGRRRPEPGSRRRRGGHFPGAPGGGMRSMPIPTLGGGFGGVPPEILEQAANSVENTRGQGNRPSAGGPPSGPIRSTDIGPGGVPFWDERLPVRRGGGGPSLNVGPGFAGGGRMGADSRPDISRNPGYKPEDMPPAPMPPTPFPGVDVAAQLARRRANYDRQMAARNDRQPQPGGGIGLGAATPPLPMPITTLPIPNPRPGGPPVPNPTGGGGGGAGWDAAPPYTQPTPIADTIPSSTNRPRPLPQSTPPFPSYPPGGGPVTTNRRPMTNSDGVGLPQPPEAQAFQNYLRSKGQ